MPGCGILILAAGGSTRLGFAKQLVRIDGVTLLRRIVDQAIASQCRPVVIALGAQAEEMRAEIDGLPVTVAVNDRWATGMGSSIRGGVGAMISIDPDIDAILIALCDQPRITARMFDQLVAAHFRSKRLIAAAEYAGALGTPAVFSSSLLPELLELPDTAGGRTIIQRHLTEIERLAIPEAAMDLDTPNDLAQLARLNNISTLGLITDAPPGDDTDKK